MADPRFTDRSEAVDQVLLSRRRFGQGMVASALGLTGAGALAKWHALAQKDPGEGSLDVIVWGNAQDVDSQTNAVNLYVEQFPQVKVTVTAGDCGVNFPACKTLIAGGTMADIIVPGIWNYNAMVDAGVLEGIESYIEADGLSLSDFNDKSIDSLKALSDQKLYGLPMGYNCQSLYFNQDMFDAAGLAYPDPTGNYTWEDVRAWSLKLTLDENGNAADSPNFNGDKVVQWGLWTGAVGASMPNSDHILLSFGGSYMNLPDRQTCNLEHPDSIAAWQFIQDMIYVDKTVPGPDANQEQAGFLRWVTGQVAMQTGSHEQVGLVAEQNPEMRFDMAALPKGKAGNATNVQYHIWSIYKESENKDNAWHLIRWLATDGSVMGKPEGDAPLMSLIPAYGNLAEGSAFLGKPGEPEHLKEAQLDPTAWELCVYPTAYNQKTDDITGQDGWGPALDDIINNRKPAAQALAGINAKIDEIMQR
jgi:multiple sugar transport system substrate-binding protein